MVKAEAPAEILVVDDDRAIGELLRHMLGDEGHRVSVAENAADARRLIQRQAFDIVLCDIQLPGESGCSLAAHIAAEYPATAVVMVTALDDAALAGTAVASGAVGYIVKPFRRSELLATVNSALRGLELAAANRRQQDLLEHQLIQVRAELRDALRRLHQEEAGQRSDADTMNRLARAVEYRSHETGAHINRVGAYCALIGERMGLDAGEAERIRVASVMHDVGKVAIPDDILLKPGSLTAPERRQMERHAEFGYEVLESEDELMHLAAMVAWSHHEWFAGGGYPRGLQGDAIPLGGRITAVADVFDALTHERVYRPALSLEQVLTIMADGRATHFDPDALDPFLESLDDALAIAYADEGT